MGVISGYPDDTAIADDDKYLTLDNSGATKLTPAGDIKDYVISAGAAKVIRHNFGSGTGTKTVTGVGFSPKSVIITGPSYGVATISWVMNGMAAYDGSSVTQDSHGFFARHSTSRTRNFNSTTQAFYIIDDTAAVVFSAAVTSFDADGMTVNVATGNATADFTTFALLFTS